MSETKTVCVDAFPKVEGTVVLPLGQYEKMKESVDYLRGVMADETRKRVAAENDLRKYVASVAAKLKEFSGLACQLVDLDEPKAKPNDIRAYVMNVRAKAQIIVSDAIKYGTLFPTCADEEYAVQHAQDDGWELVGPDCDDEDEARAAADECRKKYPGQKYRVVARIVTDWEPVEAP